MTSLYFNKSMNQNDEFITWIKERWNKLQPHRSGGGGVLIQIWSLAQCGDYYL